MTEKHKTLKFRFDIDGFRGEEVIIYQNKNYPIYPDIMNLWIKFDLKS